MTIQRWSRWQRPWLVGMVVAGGIGVAAPGIGLGIVLPLLVAMVLGGFLVVPGFGRMLYAGVVGGALTGAVVLGGLLRVAMRIVALTDPAREPEFTGATLVIVFFGAFAGLTVGPAIAAAQRLWRIRPILPAAVVGGAGLALFLLAPDLRRELFEEGVGAALNIPLFTSAFFAFGWSAAKVIARLGAAATAPAPEVAVAAAA